MLDFSRFRHLYCSGAERSQASGLAYIPPNSGRTRSTVVHVVDLYKTYIKTVLQKQTIFICLFLPRDLHSPELQQ